MRVVVLQPSYLPWLGYFDQMRRADVFVYYDDVQYDRGGWRNRNRIRTHQGWQWLTVPVKLKGRFGCLIRDAEIDNRTPWARKHLESVRQSYAKAPYSRDVLPLLESLLRRSWNGLSELNIDLTEKLANAIGLSVKTVRSSELGVEGSRSERLVGICKHLGATQYLTGDAAAAYLEHELFEREDIEVEYQNYRHPTYPQIHGEFTPFLSAVDLLFNCGPQSLDILKGDNP